MSSKTSREEIINQQWEVCIELSLRQTGFLVYTNKI